MSLSAYFHRLPEAEYARLLLELRSAGYDTEDDEDGIRITDHKAKAQIHLVLSFEGKNPVALLILRGDKPTSVLFDNVCGFVVKMGGVRISADELKTNLRKSPKR